MKNQLNQLPPTSGRIKHLLATLWSLTGLAIVLISSARAELPTHNVSAGNITVIQNDTGNTATSVTTFLTLTINDFRVRGSGTGTDTNTPLNSRGDFPVQIGSDATANFTNGILMSSVTQNGRDNGDGTAPFIYGVSMIENQRTNANDPTALVGSYWIPVHSEGTNGGGTPPEFNINLAGAYFPYTTFLGGFARNHGANDELGQVAGGFTNGGAMNQLIGSPGLAIGTNYFDLGSGKSFVTFTNRGIDSRLDGVLLVVGAKNESANFGLSSVNTTNGGWNLFIKDSGQATTTTFEQDPIAFVFIPKTNTTLVSGRFLGNGTIDAFSGTSAQFTVTSNSVGTYELKIPGKSPASGVLIISPEGGKTINQDNFVSYQVNGAGDGWIIQSRDCPVGGLESPGATEGVASFVYVPGATPGFSVTPTNNLVTTESGGTATFNVALHTKPNADVTIPISSSNPAEGITSVSSLTFTTNDWNVPQTVTITGQDDAVVDGTVAYTIVLSPATSADANYNGRDPSDVSVVNADNEGGVTVAPTSGLTTTEAGGTATFTIRLNSQPAADVTIGLSSSRTSEGTVSPTSVIFTSSNWNQDQTVTVTGVDDFIDDGDMPYSIITGAASSSDPSYNNFNAADVSVVNIDNDTAALVFNLNTLNVVSVVEGSTTSYTIALATQPTTNVVLSMTSSDTIQGGTVTSSLTFTPQNWNTPQGVTVTAANDTVIDGNTSFFVTNTVSSTDNTYSSLPVVAIPFKTLDNEGTITPTGEDAFYTIGGPAVFVAFRASISDPYSPNYNGGTLTVSISANSTTNDVLAIRNSGTAAGQISVSGNTVSYGGTAIGTFAGGTSGTFLVFSLNSASTPTATEALLQAVTFQTTNNSSTSRRSVSIVLVDGDGGTSSASTGVRVSILNVVNFQQGADYGFGVYTSEADIQLKESDPSTAYPTGGASGLFVDFPRSGIAETSQALMRFSDIIGDAPGQIPTNAIIVSADLILRLPPEDANASGDGSPLYRMLIPFDATNDTWSSTGFGIDLDNVEATNLYFSFFGSSNASGAGGDGTISFSVLPDIVAWQKGQPNYGWVMPGWNPNGTDGTVIRPGETPVVSERPRLRVAWLPATVSVATFRQGVNGYTNAHDTRIRAVSPDVEASALATIGVDWTVSGSGQNEDQVLIRFDNIIGSNTNQIPANSQVFAAMLDLASTTGDSQGNGGQFFAMLTSWQDTNTWNVMGNGIQTDGIEAASIATANAGSAALTSQVQAGNNSFDLTSDVQAWANGTRPNYGWAILPWTNGANGWFFDTADNATESSRPQLRVYYIPGAPSAAVALTISRSGNDIQISWPSSAGGSLESTSTLTGPIWQPVAQTPATVGNQKVVTINNPAGIQFYRLHQ